MSHTLVILVKSDTLTPLLAVQHPWAHYFDIYIVFYIVYVYSYPKELEYDCADFGLIRSDVDNMDVYKC